MNQSATLTTLIKHFDSDTRQLLEQAIALALQYQHQTVQLEHVLNCAMQHQTAFMQLCQRLGLNTAALSRSLVDLLESLPKQTQAATPHLSHTLVEIIQTAWQFASLDRQAPNIQIQHLLVAALQLRDELRYAFSIEILQLLDTKVVISSLSDKPSQPKQADVLTQYTENLTQKAAQGQLDPVIGREVETQQLINILCRRRQNNPILVGEAGVGKTAIVEGLALNIQHGNVPEKFKNTQLLTLDITALQAGASMKGEFEQRLKDIIEAIKNSPDPIILFIDEVHNLMGAGSKSETGDAANLLKPALARGELRTIAATTYAEYKKHIEHDAALTRRFEMVKVEEPSEAQATTILRGIKAKLEKHHQVSIDDSALQAAVKLSARYIPARQLPDKAVSLLDTACARAHLSQTTLATPLTLKQAELEQTRLHQTQLQHEQQFTDEHNDALTALEKAINKQTKAIDKLNTKAEKEKALFTAIQTQRNAINHQKSQDKTALQQLVTKLATLQGETPTIFPSVSPELIANVVSDWTGIPLSRMLKDTVSATLSLESSLKKRVVGQDAAIKTISEHLQISRANLHDPNKPRGIFFLAGTSGVGKTETALALAELLYGGEQNLTVINMSEFKEAHKISMLTGAPAGYVGYGEGGILTEAVKRKPYSVILLDEMEKAHPSVQEIFYQVFDKGMMMDGEGCQVDFKNTLILMASNAGAEVMQKNGSRQQLDLALKHYFKPAFLGRVTLIPYQPLAQDTLTQIVKMKLAKIAERAEQQYQCQVKFSQTIISDITKKCTDASTGARNIDLIINQHILPKLSQFFLNELLETHNITNVNVTLTKHQLKISGR